MCILCLHCSVVAEWYTVAEDGLPFDFLDFLQMKKLLWDVPEKKISFALIWKDPNLKVDVGGSIPNLLKNTYILG